MPPKPKWSETDEKGFIWIYNYVKSLPGYGDARKEDFMYKYSKNLLAIINRTPQWSDCSKAEGLLHRCQVVNHTPS